jgi:DedD protein
VNDILKQRLVGALILLALGVVFWPIIFVGPDEQEATEQPSIPTPPAVSTSPIPAPEQGVLRGSPEAATEAITDSDSPLASDDQGGDDSNKSDAAATHLPAKPTVAEPVEKSAVNTHANLPTGEVRSEPPQRLAMDAKGVPVAWTLQVTTVSSSEKAEVLRKRLLELHHKAYVTTLSRGGKSLYRICIGPKFERVELEKLQAGINAEFGVTSIVTRYTP